MTRSSSTLYFLISLAVLIRAYPTRAQYCYNTTGNFTSSSPYAKNREAVLNSLPPNVAAHEGFYATSTGESPNTVYAITFCRGDTSADICGSCVGSAVQDLVVKCPNQKAAYSGGTGDPPCFIRYSDTPIYGILQTHPTLPYYNVGNITMDQDQFDSIWRNLTQTLVWETANGSSKLKFAKGQTKLPDSKTIYSVTQCSPDLTPNDCESCLSEAIDDYDKCCRGKQGGGVYKPSCIFRWDLYPFLESNTSPPPSSSPPPVAPLAPGKNIGKATLRTLAAIIISVVVFLMLLFVGCCCLRRMRAQKINEAAQEESGVSEIASLKSLQFDWDILLAATNNFSQENKIGEGGFGEVYQGRFPNGQEIAVKKLSHSSGQGVEEFKNEIVLVAKLQHRNLVRLLGFAWKEGKSYSYMNLCPTRVLTTLYPEKSKQLHWPRRYKIISGIARGMLYLHEESRLRVIHRDLKASNILLDNDMNPKISDFGMARIFRVDQTNASTRRIVGTYGYMSPEYAMHGHFSQKSDVYSFGILLLEIICGKRNNYYYQSDGGEVLASYVWKHWRDNAPLEIVDPTLGESYSRSEVLRCIHISLLCVQEDLANRPTMANIVLALSSQTLSLPLPREPAFFFRSQTEPMINFIGNGKGHDQFTSGSVPSVNEVSITEVYPR
ncbi:hypothetical protein ACJRO7_021775 [Eucalyptus globulus]|uniref:Uncharacterized protein n=1 Tax=Eucalyptus globulus TaxID=34317 RepID=A0ABD3KQG9_EUCGL